jgi:hypothetical protein
MDKRKFKKYKRGQVLDSKNILACFVCVALTTACQSIKHKTRDTSTPSWVTATPQSQTMIYGVGSAPVSNDTEQSKQAARESARLALAKQLNVIISADTTIKQTANNQSMQFLVDEVLKSNVPKIQLQGVKIEEEHSSNNTVYALASFNRTEAIMQTELEINALDEAIKQTPLDNISKKILIKNAITLRNLALKRQSYNDYLVMLQSARLNKPSIIDDKLNLGEQKLNELTFSIAMADKKYPRLPSLIARGLSSNGLNVVGDNADFNLIVSLEWQDIEKSGTFYNIVDGSLIVYEQNKEKAHYNIKVKSASSFKKNAESKAIDKLGDKLANQVANFLHQTY